MSQQRFRCYTRTGDDGTSSLFSGERRSKQDPVFQALGDVDELVTLATPSNSRAGTWGPLALRIPARAGRPHAPALASPCISFAGAQNSVVGVSREYVREQGGLDELSLQLMEIQSRLLDVGSAVATPASSS